MIISEMNVKLTASTSGFAKNMDKARDKLKGFRKGLAKTRAALVAFASGVGIAAVAVAAIVWPVKKIFDLGASIEETGSKFDTVFGPEAGAKVSKFLDNFANKAGLTTSQAKGLVATTGAIAQGMGFTQKASGEVAVEITKLAGDLASFNNLPTEEVLMGINTALTGEKEQLKRLGITYRDVDVQAQALANTGKTVAANLTMQEKATASLQIITQRAGVAVGDLDRTSGSAANVAKRLGATLREIGEAISTALMPAFRHILKGMDDNEEALQNFKTAIVENTGVISAWAIVAIEAFQMVAMIIAVPVRLVKNMTDTLVVGWKLLKSIVTLDWGGITDAMLEQWGNIKDIADSVVDVWDAGADVVSAIAVAVGGANEKYKELANTVQKAGDAMNNMGKGEDGEGDPLGPTITAAITLDEKLKDLSESFSKNFVDRMTQATMGAKDAFGGFFAYMKKELVKMAMRALMFRAIMGIGGKIGIDTKALGGFAKGVTGFSPATGGGDTGDAGAGTPILSGRAANVAPRGTIVNQNIHFEVSAIDGQSAAAFIKQQGGAIADVIATAAKDSTAYRRQLQGA